MTDDVEGRKAFERLLRQLRPRLHRYCARMTGSAIDGEDVMQEAMMKAIEAFVKTPSIVNLEAWLFRIAHNTALDLLRRRARRDAALSDWEADMVVDPVNPTDERQIAVASLRTFMRLPVAQRSAVILMDVLGYSLREISGVMDTGLPAVKAALHRGRARLRALANEPHDYQLPPLAESQRALLSAYVDRFNARDFDAIREMLADEVRLELVAKTRMNGRKQVGTYLSNYAQAMDWMCTMGMVEGQPAVLVHAPDDPSGKPIYFVLLKWSDGRLLHIRDFRYARYAIEGAELTIVER